MATRNWELEESAASFFRIIMPSVLDEQKLPLPIQFVWKYGDEVSNFVRVKVPPGVTWCVRIERGDEGKTFRLSDGWEKIMKHYNIQFGYFLTFRYTGNSQFKVHIFDLTATEIDYPPITADNTKGPADIRGCSSGKKKVSQHAVKASSMTSKSLKSRQATEDERKRALSAASMYKPRNPSFTVALKRYSVEKCWTLSVPTNFGQKYLSKVPKMIELEDSDGKKWPVRYIIYHSLGRSPSLLSKGWAAFVEGNKLKEGDACVFEAIQTSKPILKVSVFRANEKMHT